jgi:DNA polymerase IIIc chi subunit
MAQQTAVEYLFEQLWDTPKDKFIWHAILKKAKEIEQQQIIDTTTQENIRCTQIANDTLKVLGIEPLFMVDVT